MGEKLVEATDPVPKGRNNQEPGTEVPGKHNQRVESPKGRHKTTFLPIRPSWFDPDPQPDFLSQGCRPSSSNKINPTESSNPLEVGRQSARWFTIKGEPLCPV